MVTTPPEVQEVPLYLAEDVANPCGVLTVEEAQLVVLTKCSLTVLGGQHERNGTHESKAGQGQVCVPLDYDGERGNLHGAAAAGRRI